MNRSTRLTSFCFLNAALKPRQFQLLHQEMFPTRPDSSRLQTMPVCTYNRRSLEARRSMSSWLVLCRDSIPPSPQQQQHSTRSHRGRASGLCAVIRSRSDSWCPDAAKWRTVEIYIAKQQPSSCPTTSGLSVRRRMLWPSDIFVNEDWNGTTWIEIKLWTKISSELLPNGTTATSCLRISPEATSWIETTDGRRSRVAV